MTPTDPETGLILPVKDPFWGATVWTIDPILKRIDNALAALGGTSAAVARRLAAMRCAGERGNVLFCPVTNYLKRQPIGRFEVLMLSGGWLEVKARDGWVETVRVPLAVEIFQQRFDRGEFPACASADSGPGDGFVRPDWHAINAEPAAEPVAA